MKGLFDNKLEEQEMNKKALKLIFAFVLVLTFGLIGAKTTQAAAYGAKQQTTPKRIRGTWYLYKTSAGSYGKHTGLQKKYLHPYRKLRITAHTITFTTAHGKRGLKGNYKLYKLSKASKFSSSKLMKAEKYGIKHKWISLYRIKKSSISFTDQNWLQLFQSSAAGNLTRTGSKLVFENGFSRDTFRR